MHYQKYDGLWRLWEPTRVCFPSYISQCFFRNSSSVSSRMPAREARLSSGAIYGLLSAFSTISLASATILLSLYCFLSYGVDANVSPLFLLPWIWLYPVCCPLAVDNLLLERLCWKEGYTGLIALLLSLVAGSGMCIYSALCDNNGGRGSGGFLCLTSGNSFRELFADANFL